MLKYAVDSNKYKDRDDSQGEEYYHEEYQYLNLLNDLSIHGNIEKGRNGSVHTGIGSADRKSVV